MRPYHIVLCVLGIVFLMVAVFTAVQEGKGREDCRNYGGVPVKTDHGYACVKRGA